MAKYWVVRMTCELEEDDDMEDYEIPQNCNFDSSEENKDILINKIIIKIGDTIWKNKKYSQQYYIGRGYIRVRLLDKYFL